MRRARTSEEKSWADLSIKEKEINYYHNHIFNEVGNSGKEIFISLPFLSPLLVYATNTQNLDASFFFLQKGEFFSRNKYIYELWHKGRKKIQITNWKAISIKKIYFSPLLWIKLYTKCRFIFFIPEQL